MTTRHRRLAAVVAPIAAVTLLLTACGANERAGGAPSAAAATNVASNAISLNLSISGLLPCPSRWREHPMRQCRPT